MMEVFQAKQETNWEQVIIKTDMINNRVYSVDPTSTPVYWYRGVAHFSLNRVEEALKDFKLAQKAHPWHIHVLNNIGSCYMILNNLQLAEEHYLKALTISPSFKESKINLSIVHYNRGKYRQAYGNIKKFKNSGDPRVSNLIKALQEKLQL
jgi:tetratricopeptide (TPR) repeat protein